MTYTVKEFRQLTQLLDALPADTALTIGTGYYENDFDEEIAEAAAMARRQLVMGDNLDCMQACAVVVEPAASGGGRLEARLVIAPERVIFDRDPLWRDYVYREAMRLGIIEPNDNPQKTDNHGQEENNHNGCGDSPDPGLHPAGRDFFDPDRDAIGI